MSLYVYTPQNNSLVCSADLNDLADFLGASRSKWKSRILFRQHTIYYHVQPISDWDFLARWSSMESSEVEKLAAKYSEIQCVSLNGDACTGMGLKTFEEELLHADTDSSLTISELKTLLPPLEISKEGLAMQP